ncbi:MAG: WbqC family protein [Chitinivibrionales bacterium]|nr:WbqC family protein [Chitinivibrionales bacterium]
MKIAIHQPQYMPWSGYFHKMASCDLFVFLDDVQFKKNEWQNRNRIRNAQGWQWLSVPTSYKFPQCINQVQISYEKEWRTNHLKSLEMCYSSAPGFKLYHSDVINFYGNGWATIDECNIASVNLLMKLLGISTPVERTSSYKFGHSATERLIEICRYFKADTYLAGAGGHDYMDVSLFVKAGINLEFQEFKCPVYPQYWRKREEDFIPNLSMLDLIFNCGPNSFKILMNKNPIEIR